MGTNLRDRQACVYRRYRAELSSTCYEKASSGPILRRTWNQSARRPSLEDTTTTTSQTSLDLILAESNSVKFCMFLLILMLGKQMSLCHGQRRVRKRTWPWRMYDNHSRKHRSSQNNRKGISRECFSLVSDRVWNRAACSLPRNSDEHFASNLPRIYRQVEQVSLRAIGIEPLV